jgi:hypothetical protein
MSYQGVVEIAIQLESFKNLDLYHQGLYNVRFRIYQEIDNQVRYKSFYIPRLFSLIPTIWKTNMIKRSQHPKL